MNPRRGEGNNLPTKRSRSRETSGHLGSIRILTNSATGVSDSSDRPRVMKRGHEWRFSHCSSRVTSSAVILLIALSMQTARAESEPVDFVDPLINSDNARIFQTKTASRPFGLVQLAPDTVVGKGFWGGYSYGTANIKGFGHVRDWRIAGLLVMPTTGCVDPSGPDAWNSDFSHETEVVQAGYHKVVLDRYGITVELTSTMRVGMHRWTFDKSGVADVMFDMITILKEAHPVDCQVKKASDTELEGWVQMNVGYKVFFVAQFDKAMDEFRAWKKQDLGPVDEVSGFPVVAYPRFKVSSDDVVQMKCALSYCSIEQARSNMVLELDHWNFDKVRSDSRAEWNELLDNIEVEGGTIDQKRKFYTDLWHVLLGRSACSDANGKYPDRMGPELVIRDLPRKNIASLAGITASSMFSTDYAPDKAVDGIIGKNCGQWQSGGERNPWIKLSWPSTRTLNRIDLFDRPGPDNANSGKLVFSDSTTIDVTDIPANGEGTVVTFANKTVDWVRFEVTGGSGTNVGLSEIKARDAYSPPEFKMYNSDSLWWTMWNLNVLWGMAYPDVLEEWVQSSLQHYDDDPKHRIPWGTIAGDHSWIMSGAQRTPLIARAIQMDMENIDIIKAFKALLIMHENGPFKDPAGNVQWADEYKKYGYVPVEAVSFAAGQTVEHAYCDWVLAQVVEKMGDAANHEYFLGRSKSWENIWNPETGYLMPRHRDGSWPENFDPFHGKGYKGYIEGNAWGHLWFNVHDVMGLCNRMGGEDYYCKRLEKGFKIDASRNFLHIGGYVDYGNQPSCQLAHLFNYAGKPWLSQYWVRQVNEKAYGDVQYNTGLGVGDEDQGQMGGVSALMSMGLFSIRGGCDKDPIYEITAPVFDQVTIHLDPEHYEGEQFVIRTVNNSVTNCYIQSASLDGQPHNKCWLYHRDFADGGELELTLGAKPNHEWGSMPGDWPPSESEFAPEPVAFLNIAPDAEITSSSEFNSDFQDENVAKNPFSEWASSGEQNPWIKLDWGSGWTISRISIRDRVNLADHATGGIFTFSDGSTVRVSGIPNDGTAKEVRFPKGTVTWVRFQVSGGSGPNVGLHEIKVYRATDSESNAKDN